MQTAIKIMGEASRGAMENKCLVAKNVACIKYFSCQVQAEGFLGLK